MKTHLSPQHRSGPFRRTFRGLARPTLLFGLLVVALSTCDQGVPVLDFQALRAFPHDTLAYTQGLLFYDGRFFESTGRLGSSSVRKVDPESGEVIRITSLAQDHFGEGLARVGTELIQLTWHAGLAFVYDLETLSLQKTFEYEGEGWGLCFDGEFLHMSDGSSRLSRRDPETFEVVDELWITEGGYSVSSLNELECVGDVIYANVFQTNRIVRIDKTSGHVTGEIDGYQLSLGAERGSDPEAVLNGIAHDPEKGTLFVTGKLWDRIYEVQIGGD